MYVMVRMKNSDINNNCNKPVKYRIDIVDKHARMVASVCS